MADSGRIAGDRVFCHECNHQWDRNQGGLQCPECHSEFTEILSDPPTPNPSELRNPLSPTSPDHPLYDHNPWANEEFPDPDEGDINTVRFNTRLGNGTISFTTRTYTTGRGPHTPRPGDPADAMRRDFEMLLGNILGVPRNRATSPFNDPFPPMGGNGRRAYDEPEFFPSPFAPMFSAVFSNMNNLQPLNQGRSGPGGGHAMPPHPMILLQQLLNPANAAHGDAVFSQEALDRIVSQLMEQNAGSTAPGPAPEAAIEALPKRTVEPSMLGSDGKAECSICMDNVDVGDEVTFLPCNHWFHGSCVSAWLKEHDTCPHCRQSITKPPTQPDSNQGEPSRPSNSRRTSRRHSSLSGAPESSRRNPVMLPDSSGPHGGSDSYYDRSPREYQSRRQSRSESTRSGGNSGSGGGVSGWFRNRFGSSSEH